MTALTHTYDAGYDDGYAEGWAAAMSVAAATLSRLPAIESHRPTAVLVQATMGRPARCRRCGIAIESGSPVEGDARGFWHAEECRPVICTEGRPMWPTIAVDTPEGVAHRAVIAVRDGQALTLDESTGALSWAAWDHELRTVPPPLPHRTPGEVLRYGRLTDPWRPEAGA